MEKIYQQDMDAKLATAITEVKREVESAQLAQERTAQELTQKISGPSYHFQKKGNEMQFIFDVEVGESSHLLSRSWHPLTPREAASLSKAVEYLEEGALAIYPEDLAERQTGALFTITRMTPLQKMRMTKSSFVTQRRRQSTNLKNQKRPTNGSEVVDKKDGDGNLIHISVHPRIHSGIFPGQAQNRNITHTTSPIDVPYTKLWDLFCLRTVGAPCSKLPSKGMTVSFQSACGKQC